MPCSFHYQYAENVKTCPWPAFFDWLSDQKSDDLKDQAKVTENELPFDKDGICLFHSRNREFKQSHATNRKFRDLVSQYYRATAAGFKQIEFLDCDEFFFVGEATEHTEFNHSEVVDFSDMDFGTAVSFKGATFEDEVWFTASTFIGTVSFEKVLFNGSAYFDDAKLQRRAIFNRAIFSHSAGFRQTAFLSGAQFNACQFREEAAFNLTEFSSHASFDRAIFLGPAFFTEVQFKYSISDSSASFHGTRFENSVRFEKCNFHGEVTFQAARFTNGQFIGVEFSPIRKLLLDEITVLNSLIFKSLDPNNKVFSHAVSFRIAEDDVKGKIVFENANVHFLEQQDIVRRLAAPTIGSVIFGTGCDRYKLRIEFEIPIEQKWMFLIEEIAGTFAMFIDVQALLPANLHVECEYGVDKITIRYFADCDLTQEKFERTLRQRAPAFAELLKDPTAVKQVLNNSEPPEYLIRAYDVYRKTVAAQMGIIPRVQLDPNWTLEQTAAVLKSVGLPQIQIAVEVHQHFKQFDILSIGTRKYSAGGNLTLGEQRSV